MPHIIAKLFGPQKAPKNVDLLGLRNAWIGPNGEVHPVKDYGHCNYAYDKLGAHDYKLQERGWIRLSSNTWDTGGWVTQAQYDFIYEWKTLNGYTFNADDYVIA